MCHPKHCDRHKDHYLYLASFQNELQKYTDKCDIAADLKNKNVGVPTVAQQVKNLTLSL